MGDGGGDHDWLRDCEKSMPVRLRANRGRQTSRLSWQTGFQPVLPQSGRLFARTREDACLPVLWLSANRITTEKSDPRKRAKTQGDDCRQGIFAPWRDIANANFFTVSQVGVIHSFRIEFANHRHASARSRGIRFSSSECHPREGPSSRSLARSTAPSLVTVLFVTQPLAKSVMTPHRKPRQQRKRMGMPFIFLRRVYKLRRPESLLK